MKNSLFALVLFVLFIGCSTNSDSNSNSTTSVVPIAPSNLTGIVASTTIINLSWTDNSTNETGFKIERKIGIGTYAIVGTTATDVTTFNNIDLTPSTTYTYRVYSYNAVGSSPTYSNELTLTTIGLINIPGPNVTDIDGNTYQSISNCGQTWTKSDLNVSKYSDGTIIPAVTNTTQWANLTTGAWCYYENSNSNGTTYGKLYNWYAVMGIHDAASATNLALRKNLAPTGWHIPTDTEWTLFTDCLGGTSVAGGKMKEAGTAHWASPNTAATNQSGFTGLPNSGRLSNGNWGGSSAFGGWWSTSETDANLAWIHYLNFDQGNVNRNIFNKRYGLSVRCVKN